ncbi:MAG: hypothetical protein JWP27_482 [Flaviaesturariibacter sp.]|nr:hypothetical protein [Flaviaesturariibacter sp.]
MHRFLFFLLLVTACRHRDAPPRNLTLDLFFQQAGASPIEFRLLKQGPEATVIAHLFVYGYRPSHRDTARLTPGEIADFFDGLQPASLAPADTGGLGPMGADGLPVYVSLVRNGHPFEFAFDPATNHDPAYRALLHAVFHLLHQKFPRYRFHITENARLAGMEEN